MDLSVQTKGLVNELGIDAAYRAIARAGFTAVDWNLDLSWKRSDVNLGDFSAGCIFERSLDDVLSYYAEELSAMKKYGLHPTQAHAPYPAYSIHAPGLTEYAIPIYRRCIEFCAAVGIPRLVIHGICRLYTEEKSEAEVEAQNLALYRSLIPVLKETDVTVCLENIFTRRTGLGIYAGSGADAKVSAQMIDRLNEEAGKECFGFCLDTGHLHLLRMDFRSFVPVLGHRIKCLHVNDNDQTEDRHLVPYAGTADWEHFYGAMRDICYDGALNFETHKQYSLAKLKDPAMIIPWLGYLASLGREMIRRIQE